MGNPLLDAFAPPPPIPGTEPVPDTVPVTPTVDTTSSTFPEGNPLAQAFAPPPSAAPVGGPTGGALIRGLKSGLGETKAQALDLWGLTKQAFGNDQGAADTLAVANQISNQANSAPPRYSNVEELAKYGNLGDFFSWAAYNLGQQVPNLATVVGTGGLGGFVGKKVAELMAGKVIKEEAGRLLLNTFLKRGAISGAYIGSTAIETGSTAEEQYQAFGKTYPGVALTAGMIKGALEEVTPLALASRFGLSRTAASALLDSISGAVESRLGKGILGRVVGGAAGAFGTEATTEGLQEFVDIAAHHALDNHYQLFDAQARSRILNAAATGGLVGAVFGGLAHGLGAEHANGEVGAPGPANQQTVDEILAGQGAAPPVVPATAGAAPVTPVTPATATTPIPPVPPPAAGITTTPQVPGVPATKSDITLEMLPKTVTTAAITKAGFEPPNPKSAVASHLGNAIQSYNVWKRMQATGKASPEAMQVHLTQAQFSLQKAIDAGLKLAEPPAPVTGEIITPVQPKGKGGTPVAPTVDFNTATVQDLIPQAKDPMHEAVLQGVRNAIEQQGGVAKLSPQFKQLLASKAMTPALLSGVYNRVHRSILATVQIGRVVNKNPTNEAQWQSSEDSAQVADTKLVKNQMHVTLQDKTGKKFDLVMSIDPGTMTKLSTDAVMAQSEQGDPILTYPRGRTESGKLFRPSIFERGPRGDGLTWATNNFVEVTDAKGRIYRPQDMERGDVRFRLDGPQPFYTPQLLRLITAIIKAVAPTRRVIIQFGPKPAWESVNNLPTIGGLFKPLTDGYAGIWVNTTARKGHVSISTLFHEIGHLIVWEHFNKAGIAIQTALYNEYYETLKKLGKSSKLDILFQLSDPVTAHFWGTQKEVLKADWQSFKDWYDLDEYLAEQASRAFLLGGPVSSIVDKFAKGAATKLHEALDMVNKTGLKLGPAEAIGGWFNDLVMRKATKEMPLTLESMLETSKASSQENAKILGIDLTGLPPGQEILAAPPEAPESRNVNSLASFIGWGKQPGAMSDRYNGWIRMTWSILQLAQANPGIQALQQYVERVRAWSISRMQLISKANTRLIQWRRLGKEMSANLSNFLYAIDSMSYLKEGENARWPTMEEQQALAKEHGLNSEAAQLYLSIKNDFADVLNRVEAAWRADLLRTVTDPVQLQRQGNVITNEMNLMRQRPYFPHSRFGDFALSVRDEKGKLVNFQQFETQRGAQDAVTQAKQLYPGHQVVLDKIPNDSKSFRGLPPGMLSSLATKLKLNQEQKKWLENFSFELSPANSFAKKFKRRKDIAGYSLDAQRAYANYFLHAAGHIARLEHGAALQDAVTGILNSRTTLPDLDIQGKSQRVAIGEWSQRHLDYIMDGGSEWSSLRSAAFQFYLGFMVSSALMNMTQVPMVAAPYLSAQYGTGKALNALRGAAANITKFYNLDQSSLPPDLLAAIKLGIEHGFLDEAQASELAALSEGSAIARILPGSKLQRGLMWFAEKSAYMFQATEKMNRRIVFRAAYDLAKNNPDLQHLTQLTARNSELYTQLLGMGWRPEHATAFLAGREAVDATQFEYARWNRPEFMRGKKGVLFTFYMFQQNMLWFFRNQPGGARGLLVLLAAAGLMGLPGANDLDELIKYASERLFGARFKPSEELRRTLVELGLKPDLLMHGLGRDTMGLSWMGDMMNLPIPSVDLSSRLGMGQLPIVSPFVQAFTSDDPRASFDDKFGQASSGVLGATFGIGLNIAKMLSAGQVPDYKDWEKIMPLAAKNVLRAYRYASTGQEETSTGAPVAQFDLADTKTRMELAAQTLGFTPSRLRANWDLMAAQKEAMGYWQGRRAELMNEFDVARRSKDQDGLQAVRQRIREFNQTAPSGKLRISVQQLLESIKARAKARADIAQQRSPTGTMGGVARDIKSLYPEATTVPGSS